MKDPDLLEATGSEPLSYEEEVQMQKSWKDDETKCTFIIHAAGNQHQKHGDDNDDDDDDDDDDKNVNDDDKAVFHVEDNLSTMIGDVNLFLSEIDDDDDDDNNDNDIQQSMPETPTRTPKIRLQAEIDIMIGNKEYHRKGYGYSATILMLLYGAKQLNIKRFFCKINEDNISSIRLFQRLGFIQCNYAECFKQIEFELKLVCSSSSSDDDDDDDITMYSFLLDKYKVGCYKTIPCGEC